MKPRDDLHALIHALDRNEKRYIALCTQAGPVKNGAKYRALISAISQQPDYDEESLKAAFAGTGWVKQLSATKAALMDFILTALANYEAPTVQARVQAQLRHARILRAKGLYTTCERYLDSAAAMALAHELPLETLAVQEERRTMIKEQHEKRRRAALDASWQESNAALVMLSHEQALRALRDRLFLLSRQEFVLRGEEGRQEITAWMDTPLLQDAALSMSFEGRFLRNTCMALYHQLIGDRQQAHAWFHANKLHWDAHPARIAERYQGYLAVVANFLHSCCMVGDYAAIPAAVAQLQQVAPRSWNEEAELFQNSQYYQLLYHLNAVELPQAIAMVPGIEAGLRAYARKINQARLMGFRYNIAMAYLIAEDFRAARRWFQVIADAPESESRQDIRQTARIFLLICYVELDQADLLHAIYRSSYRHLLRRNRLHDIERLLFTHLRKLIDLDDSRAKADCLQAMQAALLAAQVGDGAMPPGMQELAYWLESRRSGLPIATLIRAAHP